MEFVNPFMMLGGLAIAAPIAIFLLSRFRYRTVEWAALEFLLRAIKRQQRRLRLENLILLIIRCLILIAFAVAIARPRAVSPVEVSPDEKTQNVVILLDTSFSMGYQVGSNSEETAHERARGIAKEIIGALKDGDRVLVRSFDDIARIEASTIPRNANASGRKELLLELDDDLFYGVRARGTSLSQMLQQLPRMLTRFEPNGIKPPPGRKPLAKTVFVLTDAQRHGLLDDEGKLVEPKLGDLTKQEIEAELGATLVLIDCGAEQPRNLAVTRLSTREAVVGQNLPCHIEARVKNFANEDIGDLTLKYYVDVDESIDLEGGDAEPQRIVSLSVPAGEEILAEPLTYQFATPGLHRVAVHLSSDALTVDNWRHYVVDVRESVRVLLVDGDPSNEDWEGETDFLYEILNLSVADDIPSLIQTEVCTESELAQKLTEGTAGELDGGDPTQDLDIVLLANVPSLTPEDVSMLEDFVRLGRTVIFALGSRVDLKAYNEFMYREGRGLLPAELVRQVGGTSAAASLDEDAPAWVMNVGDREHPVAGLFTTEDMVTHLRDPSIFGFFEVKIPETGLTTVPLRVNQTVDDNVGAAPSEEQGLPLLVERRFGRRGRVGMWLTTVDADWNRIVPYVFNFIFWREYVLHLAQQARPEQNLRVGGQYASFLRLEEFASKVRVKTPVDEEVAVVPEKVEGEELYRLTYPREQLDSESGDDTEALNRDGLPDPGFYSVSSSNEKFETDYFAVTLDPTEGNLAKFSGQELGEALGVAVREIVPAEVVETLTADGGVGGQREYWPELLALVLALLVTESILAAVFGRRRR